MLTGLPPFDAFEDESGIDTYGKVLEYAQGYSQIPFSSDFDKQAKDLVGMLCQREASKRCSPSRARLHPFFKGSIDFMALEKGDVPPPYVPPLSGATDASQFEEVDETADGFASPEMTEKEMNVELPSNESFGSFTTLTNAPGGCVVAETNSVRMRSSPLRASSTAPTLALALANHKRSNNAVARPAGTDCCCCVLQ